MSGMSKQNLKTDPPLVYGVGCVALDMLCTVERYPRPDEKMPIRSMSWQGGGLVATALVALGRLGVRSWLQAGVGDDENSRSLLKLLEAEGVDTSPTLPVEGGAACFSFIIVDETKDSRTIVYSREGVPEVHPDDLDEGLVARSKVVLVDTVESAADLRAAQIARAHGIPVVLDAEQVGAPHVDELLETANVLIPSSSFALEWTGASDFCEAARVLFRNYRERDSEKIVVVTGGEEGAFGLSGEEEFHQPAFQVPVVDTTGCGDVFHGAFAFGLLNGWELARNLRFSCATAGLKCRALGGQAGIPNLAEVGEFLGADTDFV